MISVTPHLLPSKLPLKVLALVGWGSTNSGTHLTLRFRCWPSKPMVVHRVTTNGLVTFGRFTGPVLHGAALSCKLGNGRHRKQLIFRGLQSPGKAFTARF